jgi:hypothetical protein
MVAIALDPSLELRPMHRPPQSLRARAGYRASQWSAETPDRAPDRTPVVSDEAHIECGFTASI